MYDEQETAFIIKQTAKAKNITIKQLLENCNLSINTVSELSKGKRMSYISFAKIADALDCSMDYLMGRTDRPEISQSYSNNSISNSNNIAFGENSSVKITNEEIEKEICKVLSGLNLRERSELLTIIYNFVDEHKSEELK